MLILSNEDVVELLSMTDCLSVLERAFKELGEGKAANLPRNDVYFPAPETTGAGAYVFKAMGGGTDEDKVFALRINSDLVSWPVVGGRRRRVKVPAAHGERWVGLIALFSMETGEPLAIMQDGVIQRMRVGATNGLGIRYMARKNANKAALIGSGWQAEAQIWAAVAERDLTQIDVFSPNPENRRKFVERVGKETGLPLRPVGTIEEAVQGKDIVLCATNSSEAVFYPQWITPGMHLSSIKRTEMAQGVEVHCDRIVKSCPHAKPQNHLSGSISVDSIPELQSGEKVLFPKCPTLDQLVSGLTPGRQNDKEVTWFINNMGLGIQFAALAKVVYQHAQSCGKGRQIPTDWFLENVHP